MSSEPTKASIEKRAAKLASSAVTLLGIAVDEDIQSRLRLIVSDCDAAGRAAESSPKLAAAALANVEERCAEINRGIEKYGARFVLTD